MSTFLPIPSGKLAAIVTHLEMTEFPPTDTAALTRQDLTLHTLSDIDAADYKALYYAVGAEWLWFSRLRASDAEVAAILANPAVEHFGLGANHRDESTIGLLELDWREPGSVEVAFLGVVAPMLGTGAGRFLMAHAIERVRHAGVNRVWLHTCSFDHPNALTFYRRAGFRAYKREIELTNDPRQDGTLPCHVAPHVPIV